MKPRRSFILVAVMIVIGAALFIATTLIHVMQSDSALAAGSRSVEQSRALAWSGLQAVVHELNGQREVILDGERPELQSQYVLFEGEARLGVVRLLPVGPADDLLEAEAGKLDLNTVDADTLERTGFIAPDIADAIIRFRDTTLGRPYQSVAELLQVEGVNAEDLYGPIEEITPLDDAQLETGDFGERLAATYGGAEIRGLADLLTVFSFEPALQRNGTLRINLNVEWSEELGRRLTDRFSEEIAQGVKEILTDSDFRFESERRFFELLLLFEPDDPQEWVEYVDAFTFDPHDYLAGRLDFNTASYEALLGLEGMTPEQAQAIVNARENLTRDDRATVVWPALEEICEPQQYQDFAGRITTRCWNWRVRLAAGTVDAADPDGPLDEPVIYEAVIDLSAPRARLAYLRDITQLQTAAFIAANASLDDRPQPLEMSSEWETEEVPAGDASGEMSDFASDNRHADDGNESASARSGRRERGAGSARGESAERGGEQQDESSTASGDADSGGSASSGSGPRRVGRWKPGG